MGSCCHTAHYDRDERYSTDDNEHAELAGKREHEFEVCGYEELCILPEGNFYRIYCKSVDEENYMLFAFTYGDDNLGVLQYDRICNSWYNFASYPDDLNIYHYIESNNIILDDKLLLFKSPNKYIQLNLQTAEWIINLNDDEKDDDDYNAIEGKEVFLKNKNEIHFLGKRNGVESPAKHLVFHDVDQLKFTVTEYNISIAQNKLDRKDVLVEKNAGNPQLLYNEMTDQLLCIRGGSSYYENEEKTSITQFISNDIWTFNCNLNENQEKEWRLSSEVPNINGGGKAECVLAFGHILYAFVYGEWWEDKHTTVDHRIWCFDLLSDDDKWYEVKRCLPYDRQWKERKDNHLEMIKIGDIDRINFICRTVPYDSFFNTPELQGIHISIDLKDMLPRELIEDCKVRYSLLIEWICRKVEVGASQDISLLIARYCSKLIAIV